MICQCGCGGWDTLWSVFNWVRWQLRCLAQGVFPHRRHDGAAWLASDRTRERMQGQVMQRRCIYIKGDWSEHARALGFPAWNDGLRPCFDCNCFLDTMHTIRGNSRLGRAWRENEEGGYDAACNRCEISIELTVANKTVMLKAGL